jgi:endonuclease/exonuclease/phosphatase family metal-dependent hydrolase
MAIWTVHFGLDNDMWLSHIKMKNIIQELEIDVIGLLESDAERIVMGNRDITQYLAEELGMYADYGPNARKHTWGCAMLSKFPIIKSEHHLLPSPNGELACAIHATLDVFGYSVDVSISHNGQEEDPLDRYLQTTKLAEIARASQNPFVFLGYVVSRPGVDNHRLLLEKGNLLDVDKTDDDRWCQYIAFRGIERVAYARVSHGMITDTEIQTAKFRVGTDMSEHVKEDEISEEHVQTSTIKYPEMFKGSGTRGHRFHVFDRPKYYSTI